MVDWDSKERGAPISAASGVLGIYISCLACKRTVMMLWADVVKTWGVGAYTRDIARSLKCTACGESKGSIMSWADNRPPGQKHLPLDATYPIIGALTGQKRLL